MGVPFYSLEGEEELRDGLSTASSPAAKRWPNRHGFGTRGGQRSEDLPRDGGTTKIGVAVVERRRRRGREGWTSSWRLLGPCDMAANMVCGGGREMGGGIYRVWEGWLNGRRDGRRTGLEDDMMVHGARERHDGAWGSSDVMEHGARERRDGARGSRAT
uniref:Uncharacterized protein n=1 Tax=Oryza glumipatula TaxID=40148 RepID=A0A0E0A9F1_9ORYZ